MQYATHYEEGKKVSFKKFDLNLAGLLFLPDDFDADGTYPAVVVTHPGGGVKEQCSSLYAWHLARAGYVALAFDASHQGESEGLPRCLEDPFSRVEDIRSAVDYLVTLPYVDEERIGAMGVCAGGGYTMSAIQTDVRIKAAAGISTWDVGDSARNGFPGVEIENFMQKLLQEVARARTAAARGEEAPCWKYVPDGPDGQDVVAVFCVPVALRRRDCPLPQDLHCRRVRPQLHLLFIQQGQGQLPEIRRKN